MRLVFLVIVLVACKAIADDGQGQIGRLFTTPEQRQALDGKRYALEVQPIQISDKKSPKPQEKQPTIDHRPINVKGLIYNQNGRNAAWINNSNTLHGDIEQEGIKINTDFITREKVPVIIRSNDEVIRLKVGESYDPDNAK